MLAEIERRDTTKFVMVQMEGFVEAPSLIRLAKTYARAQTPQQALSADDRASDVCGDNDRLFEAYTDLAALYASGWDGADETAGSFLYEDSFRKHDVVMQMAFARWYQQRCGNHA